MKKILLLLFILLLPGPAHSWQQVVAEAFSEDRFSRSELQDIAMKSGFRQAVSQEIDRMIQARIPLERKSALMKHIDDQVGDLVQGYRQASWLERNDALMLEMEVNVDTASLRTLLRKTGVYYTSDSAWPYSLNTRGASPEDFSLLQELQLITGAVVDGNAATTLNLGKSAEGTWSGSIIHEHINLSASGSTLDQVWFDLWEYFFSRPEIQSGFVESLTLNTSGWTTTDSIMNFDMILGTWHREIEQRNIISVHSDVHSLKASWRIHSLSRESLEERLENYLGARGIDYNTQH